MKKKRLQSLNVGRPTAQEAAQRTNEILDAASEVFLRCGYRRARISDIIERLGGSRGTIYARYPTKDALFSAVVERTNDVLNAHYAGALSTRQPLRGVLEKFGLILLGTVYSRELSDLLRIVVAEAEQFPELAKKFLTRGPMHAVRMLSECLAEHPEFRGHAAGEAAEIFCSLFWGTSMVRHLLDRNYAPNRRAAKPKLKNAVRIFFAAYGQNSGSAG